MTPPDYRQVLRDFVAYCSKYEPSLPEMIVPASDEDLQQLEVLTRVSLAPEHRAFLLTMGRTPEKGLGRLLEFVAYDVDEVRQFYTQSNVPKLPSDVTFLWRYEYDSPFPYFLQVGGNINASRPVLFLNWFDEEQGGGVSSRDVAASSLLEYLYDDAVSKVRIPLLRHHCRVVEDVRKSDHRGRGKLVERQGAFCELAMRLGFVAIPYLDQKYVCFDREDALLRMEPGESGDVFAIYGTDANEAARLAEVLADNLEGSVWRNP